MALHTISSLPRISRDDLATHVRAKNPRLTILDVRDNDFIGGHILGCSNVPVGTLDYRLPELVRMLKDQDLIVFHCSLSQQRGPSSALRYLRERERMCGKGEVGERGDGRAVEEAQRVFLLEGGFVKWQEAYGEDKELTEGYAKDIWAEDW